MGNLSLCRGGETHHISGNYMPKREQRKNMKILETEEEGIILQLYGGFCALERSDATINVTSEYMIERDSNEQEKMLFEKAGDEVRKETREYLNKHQKLHYKFPFYTHAGKLPISNVIHMTLSEDKKIISDIQIIQAFIDCIQIADEELEASSLTIPMIYLKDHSLSKISKIIIQAVRNYVNKCKKHKVKHLRVIQIIGEDTKLQLGYIQAAREQFCINENSISSPKKISEKLENRFERLFSPDDSPCPYISSFHSEKTFARHYQSKEVYLEDM